VSIVTATDGTVIFYKDWGVGALIVFKPRLAVELR
jgi:hypothetical protein